MLLRDLYFKLSKEISFGIIVNGDFKEVCDADAYPDSYMEMKVDRVVAVEKNQLNIYLTDETRTRWLNLDAAEARCLGDICD